MAEKLKSIINPIRWSLLLKPLAVGAAWLLLPWWGFLIVVTYCYFIPLFRPLSLLPAFLIFVFLALAGEPSFLWAVYAGGVMALMLWIKDLLIVNRRAAYQILAFLISFAGCFLLFSNFPAWSTATCFLSLGIFCALWFWLAVSAPERQDVSFLSPAIAALLLFEVGAVIFFLPISFFPQAILLFLGSVLLFEAATDLRSLTLKQAALWGGSYAATCLLVALLVSWKI